MKKIKITGTFTNSVNNFVILDVFKPNRSRAPYEFKKVFRDSFVETISDLEPQTSYDIDIAGFTKGEKFHLTISGDFRNSPVTLSASQDFSKGFTITTNS